MLAEKRRADESERKLAETKQLSEKRGKKLEETENRVYKLQDSLNRYYILWSPYYVTFQFIVIISGKLL